MNRNQLSHLVRLVIYAAVGMMAFVAFYLMLSRPQLEETEPTKTTSTNVVGFVEAVIAKNFEKKDALVGKGLDDPGTSVLLDVVTAGPCRVLIRVENQLLTEEPKYSFCQKAEKGDKVRVRKVVSVRLGDGATRTSYKLIE